MSIVFLGTSDFAAAVLQRLAGSEEHRPALVITRPDRPRGRGRRTTSPPVAERARALDIALEQPESVNDPQTRALIAQAGRSGSVGGRSVEGQPGAGQGVDGGERQTVVVCSFGALIREPLLSEHELLNVHPSLLPRWRGAAPVERAIMAGDERTGVSIMRLTAGLDSGPVCLVESELIRADDSYGSLAPRLSELGGELLVRTLDLIMRGQAPTWVEQDAAGVTYAEKIGAEDRLLDPARSATELERVVRALHPHIGARLALADGRLLGVSGARVATDRLMPQEPADGPDVDGAGVDGIVDAPPAGVLAGRDGQLLYGTADGALELTCVQPPGGRPMDAGAYLRGHAL